MLNILFETNAYIDAILFFLTHLKKLFHDDSLSNINWVIKSQPGFYLVF